MNRKSYLAWVFGVVIPLGAMAQAGLPQVQRSGSVEYLSGGIGTDESQAIKAVSAQWPLTLEFAVNTQPRADYASDVKVTIRNSSSQQVALQTTAGGPFLLVKLPPGSYTVDALFSGRTIQQKVTIGSGSPAHAMFVWPAAAT